MIIFLFHPVKIIAELEIAIVSLVPILPFNKIMANILSE